jgi:Lipid A 3-O-deacylase (PagL)
MFIASVGRRGLMVALLLFISSAAAVAQDAQSPSPSAAHSLFDVGSTEWMIGTGNAWGIVVFHSSPGHQFVIETLSWGRVLSRPLLPGALRGRFEWAFEAVPLYAQYLPTHVWGIGGSPIVWRWNFEQRGRYVPYGELAGGVLLTNHSLPEGTTNANFTAHTGAGVRIFFRPHQALVVGYRFHHISNGNAIDRNPGVNAHAAHIAWSYLRARK